MRISEKDVEYVAKLAMLEVADNEKKELADQLSAIVEYVEQLNKQEVSGIEPTAPSASHSVRGSLRNLLAKSSPKRGWPKANTTNWLAR